MDTGPAGQGITANGPDYTADRLTRGWVRFGPGRAYPLPMNQIDRITQAVAQALRPTVQVAKETTLDQIFSLWLADVDERAALPKGDPDRLAQTTAATYRGAWGDLRRAGAHESPVALQRVKAILRRVSPGRRNAVGGALSAALHYAGRGDAMPSRGHYAYKPPITEIELTSFHDAATATVDALQRAHDRRRRLDISGAALLFTIAYTGARVSELRLALRSDLVIDQGRAKLLVEAKRGRRWLAIAPPVLEVFQLLPVGVGPWLFPGQPKDEAGHAMEFGSGPLDVCCPARAMRRHSKRLGRPLPTPQGLRRGFASEMLRRGHDVATVARHLGHSETTLLRHYARPSSEQLFDAAETMAQALSGDQLLLPGSILPSVVDGEAAGALAAAPLTGDPRTFAPGRAAVRGSEKREAS